MSRFGAFFAGVGFRTNTPDFGVGDEITAFVTGVEDGQPVARIGDTVLRVEEAPDDPVDLKVRLRVADFDPEGHRGVATYLETVGESAY